MKHAVISGFFILALAGCASGLPLGPEVAVTGRQFTAAQGVADTVARTYMLDAAGQTVEVAGAVCTITTSLYEAKLTTPARLVVPNFGPQSPDLDVSCSALGKSGSARQPIRTHWQSAPGVPGVWGPGTVGPWGDPWGRPWGWNAPAYPVSLYPDIRVMLR